MKHRFTVCLALAVVIIVIIFASLVFAAQANTGDGVPPILFVWAFSALGLAAIVLYLLIGLARDFSNIAHDLKELLELLRKNRED
ncbi:MAG: hypothetical protein ACP5F3_06995 [Candidatus Syntrophosphaera sp.]